MAGEAVEFALAEAPADVADTIRWLLSAGFGLAGERGGRNESFGNLLLEFERAGQRVVIVRDRRQWRIDIAPTGSTEPHGLQVFLWAMRGGEPELGPRRSVEASLPAQLPVGERWSAEVPAVLTWLTDGDRSAEISAAVAAGRRAMAARLGMAGPSADAS